jgi:hypothetical protein
MVDKLTAQLANLVKQKAKIQFGFNDEEIYNWNYVPRNEKD